MWWDGQLTVARRQAVESDRALLEEAHLAALGPVVLVGHGWTKERLRAQFHAEVELDCCEVISVDDRDVGYISIQDRGSCWYIDAFAILPNFQRRGVGSAALASVLRDAGRTPVRLSVFKTNRARSLYLRFGFRVIGSDRVRELMERRITEL